MPVINRIASFHKDMTAWRHDIHSHPETAFEEVRTADIVADKLKSFGIEVHRGLAKTGVVGVLRSGNSQAGDRAARRHGRARRARDQRVRPQVDDPRQDARLRP